MSRGPGHWQRFILDELDHQPGFALSRALQRALGRPLTAAEYRASHRAARTLARQGRCQIALLWDGGQARTFVARPDFTARDGVTLTEASVDAGTTEARTTYRGSLRDTARATGVSRMTVWRARRAGQPAERSVQKTATTNRRN